MELLFRETGTYYLSVRLQRFRSYIQNALVFYVLNALVLCSIVPSSEY